MKFSRRDFLKVLGQTAIVTSAGAAIIQMPKEILRPSDAEVEVFSQENIQNPNVLPYFVMEADLGQNRIWNASAPAHLFNVGKIELIADKRHIDANKVEVRLHVWRGAAKYAYAGPWEEAKKA